MNAAKSYTEVGLNAAMMVAFAIPGGAPVGAVFSVAALLVGLLWPDEDGEVPEAFRPVNRSGLRAAMDDLRNRIEEIVENAQLDDMTAEVAALAKTFHENWADALKLCIKPETGYQFIDDDTTAAFVQVRM